MDYYSIIMLFVLLGILYFFMIRPENKRRKKAEELQNSLKKGDKITTIGGIVGTIVHVDTDTIVIETSEDRVRMELTKWAVSAQGVQGSMEPQADKKKKGEKAEEEKKLESGKDAAEKAENPEKPEKSETAETKE